MKTSKCLIALAVWLFFTAGATLPAWALNPQPEPPIYQSITLPKGTVVDKLGAGHFKFRLPDGRVVEIRGLVKGKGGAAAIIGDSGIYDRTGKLIMSGRQGTLKSGPPLGNLRTSGDMIKIDDDVTWLPATITFRSEAKRK